MKRGRIAIRLEGDAGRLAIAAARVEEPARALLTPTRVAKSDVGGAKLNDALLRGDGDR